MAEASGAHIPFPIAPAPWSCKGECFWFNGYISPSQSIPYPTVSYFGETEASSAYADSSETGAWKGGLVSLMIVRYTDTPAGPYDEIMWIPGKFTVPPTGQDVLRISRIYVSTLASVYNGRKNWNIPKEQAHFTFTRVPNAGPYELPYSRVAVAPVSDPEHPFFVVDLSPTFFLSKARIPFSTSIVPMSMLMVHPPLPQSPNWKEDGRVGTDRWWGLAPLMKGKAGLFRSKGGLRDGKYGDDKGFPDVKPWSIGMWLADFELEFYVGEEPNAEKKKDK